VSRHRSPQGRRAHLGPPLFAVPATAGVGAARPLPSFTLPMRFAATVVAGGTLAAAGQHALVAALPAATDGANVLRLGVEQLLGPPAAAPAGVPAPRAVVDPVVPATPAVADATGLVKAAGLQQAAAAATAAAEKARADQAARTATAARAAAAAASTRAAAPAAGGVQMIVGTVTSGFGGRWGTAHQGLDIAAPIGTPIHAPLAGEVISSGPASGFGLWVRLQHADGTITVYGHINRSLVSVGEQVQAGQVIAEVGNRGQSTGPHLHIGVMINGAYVDPRPWLDQRGIRY
jgi:murein DD-endopeptidase MepM/ murein hydrolase activator NlpD